MGTKTERLGRLNSVVGEMIERIEAAIDWDDVHDLANNAAALQIVHAKITRGRHDAMIEDCAAAHAARKPAAPTVPTVHDFVAGYMDRWINTENADARRAIVRDVWDHKLRPEIARLMARQMATHAASEDEGAYDDLEQFTDMIACIGLRP